MIRNERQYRITIAQVEKFKEALKNITVESGSNKPKARRNKSHVHPLLMKAQQDALRSQLEELTEQIDEYNALRKRKRTVIEIDSFDELPQALVQARIAAGLTQKDLAERLGLKEQQIQRYEAMDYSSASLDRIRAVVNALAEARVRLVVSRS